eukprot:gene4510-14670_t
MGTPMSASTGRPSRGMYNSGSTIATPEQLQFYLDRVGSGAATPGGGAPDVTSPAPHMWRDYAPSMTTTPMAPTTTSPGGSVSPQVSAEESGYGGQHQQQFSFQGPTSQQDVLTLSSDEEINEVVSRLLGVVRRDWMEVWTENLREWFSKQLLGPLVNQVFTAHEAVNKLHYKQLLRPLVNQVFTAHEAVNKLHYKQLLCPLVNQVFTAHEAVNKLHYKQLLRPLVDQVFTAHEAVNKVLQKYGQDHKLPPIPDVTSPLSGPTHPSEDMEALVRHIQQWCTALSQSVGNNPNTPQGADAQELAKSVGNNPITPPGADAQELAKSVGNNPITPQGAYAEELAKERMLGSWPKSVGNNPITPQGADDQELAKRCPSPSATTPSHPQGADAEELAKALTKYDPLILMLRGKRPADLLPPAPAGYMWSRIQELAHGTCMPDYK